MSEKISLDSSDSYYKEHQYQFVCMYRSFYS